VTNTTNKTHINTWSKYMTDDMRYPAYRQYITDKITEYMVRCLHSRSIFQNN